MHDLPTGSDGLARDPAHAPAHGPSAAHPTRPDSPAALDGRRGPELDALLKGVEGPILAYIRELAPAALLRRVDAQDIAQEAALLAHRARARFAGQTAAEFFLWFRHVCRLTIRDLTRREMRQKRRPSLPIAGLDPAGADALPDASNRDSQPENLASRNEMRDLVRAALDALGSDADALRAVYFENLSVSELADKLNLSASGAKRRVRRELDRLRHRLRADHGCDASWLG